MAAFQDPEVMEALQDGNIFYLPIHYYYYFIVILYIILFVDYYTFEFGVCSDEKSG